MPLQWIFGCRNDPYIYSMGQNNCSALCEGTPFSKPSTVPCWWWALHTLIPLACQRSGVSLDPILYAWCCITWAYSSLKCFLAPCYQFREGLLDKAMTELLCVPVPVISVIPFIITNKKVSYSDLLIRKGDVFNWMNIAKSAQSPVKNFGSQMVQVLR